MAHAASFLLTITHKKEPSWVLWAWCCFCLDPLGSVNNIMKFAKGHQKKYVFILKRECSHIQWTLFDFIFFPPQVILVPPFATPCPTSGALSHSLRSTVLQSGLKENRDVSDGLRACAKIPANAMGVSYQLERNERTLTLCVCVYTLSFSQMIQSSAWINKLKQSRNWNQEKLQIDNNKANYTSLYTATFSSSQLRSFI